MSVLTFTKIIIATLALVILTLLLGYITTIHDTQSDIMKQLQQHHEYYSEIGTDLDDLKIRLTHVVSVIYSPAFHIDENYKPSHNPQELRRQLFLQLQELEKEEKRKNFEHYH